MAQPDTPVAIITGAAGGIGSAISRTLVRDGFRVALTDVNGDGLEQLVAELGDDRAAQFEVDLLDEQQVSALPQRVNDHFGRLDALVNNAGTRTITPFAEISGSEWRQTLEIDLIAPALLTAAAMPMLLAQERGSIVNIASFAATDAVAGRAAYSAAKAGIAALTRNLAVEYGDRGIRANAVAPGIIETPMTAHVFASDEMQEHVPELVPNGRPGAPQDIADAVSFLVSDRSDYVNGVLLPVDGGWSAGYRFARI